MEIESLFHLSANQFILQHSPSTYHPEFSDTVNLLELSRAYWQAHRGVFKGFFYITDNQSKASAKIEKLITKIKEKDDFPVMSYRAIPLKASLKSVADKILAAIREGQDPQFEDV